jgi:hypothetical protein
MERLTSVQRYQNETETAVAALMPDLESAQAEFKKPIRAHSNTDAIEALTQKVTSTFTTLQERLTKFQLRHQRLIGTAPRTKPFFVPLKIRKQKEELCKMTALIRDIKASSNELKALNTVAPPESLRTDIDLLQQAISNAQKSLRQLNGPAHTSQKLELENFIRGAMIEIGHLEQEFAESTPMARVRPEPRIHTVPLSAAALQTITQLRLEKLILPDLEHEYEEMKFEAYQQVKNFSKMTMDELNAELDELLDLEATLTSDLHEVLLDINFRPGKHPEEMKKLDVITDSRTAVRRRTSGLRKQIAIETKAAEQKGEIEGSIQELQEERELVLFDLKTITEAAKTDPTLNKKVKDLMAQAMDLNHQIMGLNHQIYELGK